MPSATFDTELAASREQVSRPLLRLFRAYGPGQKRWLGLRLFTSVLELEDYESEAMELALLVSPTVAERLAATLLSDTDGTTSRH